MHPPPPGSLLVLVKSGRQEGRTHQQVADRDQPLQGPRVCLPAAALLPPPDPLRLALALPLGGQGGGQLGLGAAAVGLPHECPPDFSPADVVAVPPAPHPRHGAHSLLLRHVRRPAAPAASPTTSLPCRWGRSRPASVRPLRR